MTELIRPYQPVTPAGCETLAKAVDDSVDHLRALGIRVNDAGRIPSASRVLREVVLDNAFPAAEVGLVRVSAAIKIAFDFDAIAKALPNLPNKETRDALVRALKGSLDDVGPTQSHRAQSQLRLGCVLAAGGLRPSVVQSSDRRVPDYVVQIDTLDVALETKRPERLDTIKSCVEDGVSQARAFGASFLVIALDISDVVRPPSPLVSDYELANREFAMRFKTAADAASDYIHGRKSDSGFDRLAVLTVFADVMFWPAGIPLQPHSCFRHYPEVFHHAASGLVIESARRLRASLERGIEALGATIIKRVPA